MSAESEEPIFSKRIRISTAQGIRNGPPDFVGTSKTDDREYAQGTIDVAATIRDGRNSPPSKKIRTFRSTVTPARVESVPLDVPAPIASRSSAHSYGRDDTASHYLQKILEEVGENSAEKHLDRHEKAFLRCRSETGRIDSEVNEIRRRMKAVDKMKNQLQGELGSKIVEKRRFVEMEVCLVEKLHEEAMNRRLEAEGIEMAVLRAEFRGEEDQMAGSSRGRRGSEVQLPSSLVPDVTAKKREVKDIEEREFSRRNLVKDRRRPQMVLEASGKAEKKLGHKEKDKRCAEKPKEKHGKAHFDRTHPSVGKVRSVDRRQSAKKNELLDEQLIEQVARHRKELHCLHFEKSKKQAMVDAEKRRLEDQKAKREHEARWKSHEAHKRMHEKQFRKPIDAVGARNWKINEGNRHHQAQQAKVRNEKKEIKGFREGFSQRSVANDRQLSDDRIEEMASVASQIYRSRKNKK